MQNFKDIDPTYCCVEWGSTGHVPWALGCHWSLPAQHWCLHSLYQHLLAYSSNKTSLYLFLLPWTKQTRKLPIFNLFFHLLVTFSFHLRYLVFGLNHVLCLSSNIFIFSILMYYLFFSFQIMQKSLISNKWLFKYYLNVKDEMLPESL